MARTSKLMEARRRRKLRRYYAVGGAVLAVAALAGAYVVFSPSAPGPGVAPGRPCGTIVTPHGDITVVFYADLVPTTAARFSGLFQGGYYNGLPWTRGPPEEDWVLQAGQGGSARDPIPLEINPSVKNVVGSLGAARTNDPNSATTQFYILKRDSPNLDSGYSVFASVISGMEDVNQVLKGDLITRTTLTPCPP